MRFSLLHYGIMDIDSNYLVNLSSTPNMIQIPVWGLLIQTENKNIIYDLGCMENVQENWEASQVLSTPFTPVEGGIEGQLKKVGLTCKDIDTIIVSHLHPDHFGLITKFPHCEVYVPEEEWVVAMKQAFGSIENRLSPKGLYYYKCMSAPVKKYHFVKTDDDFTLYKGLDIITLPGHCENLLGLLITVDSGKSYIFPSDAANKPENIEGTFKLPRGFVDKEKYIKSLEKLKELSRRYNAPIVFSHDMETYNKYEKCPFFYE